MVTREHEHSTNSGSCPSIHLLTPHAGLRQRQWNLSDSSLAYVAIHGTRYHRTGIVFIVLRRRDIPITDRCRDECAKLEGTTLLLSADGVLITIYRNKKVTRKVACKPKHRCPERWPTPFDRRATRENERLR